MAEAGYPEVNIKLFSGYFAAVGTPPAIVAKLEAGLRKAINDPDVSAKLKALAVTPGGQLGGRIPRHDRQGHREHFRRDQGGELEVRELDFVAPSKTAHAPQMRGMSVLAALCGLSPAARA